MDSESTVREVNGPGTVPLLQDAVLDTADIKQFLDELCRHAAETLGSRAEVLCGVTLLRHKKAATAASSSARAQAMDEIQYKFNDGPCLTASREQSTVYVPNLERESRWPEYVGAMVGNDLHSILATHFSLEGEAWGALNVYSAEVDAFDEEARARIAQYAAEASRSLRLALRIANSSERAANLKAAMEARTVIDIAVGMMMCQNNCSQEEASTILKKASSHRNIKMRDLASDIVTRHGTTPGPKTHFEEW